MFAGDNHPGTSHGEQVGVATLTLSLLQNQVLNNNSPPELSPTVIPEQWIRNSFDAEMASNMLQQTKIKALDNEQCDALNRRLQTDWDSIRAPLCACLLPYDELHAAMSAAGCQLTATDLGINQDFYREAVKNARYIRDRFSMLDLVDDSTGLDTFVQNMPA